MISIPFEGSLYPCRESFERGVGKTFSKVFPTKPRPRTPASKNYSNVTVKVLPRSGVEVTVIIAPASVAARSAMVKPIPLPFPLCE